MIAVCKDAGQYPRCGLLPDGTPDPDRSICFHATAHEPWRYGEKHCGGDCAGEEVWCVPVTDET